MSRLPETFEFDMIHKWIYDILCLCACGKGMQRKWIQDKWTQTSGWRSLAVGGLLAAL